LLVAQVGTPTGLDLEQLLQLAAGSFGTSSAMASYLGGAHTGNLTYYEGASHDIYSANVEDDLFVMIIFDRRVQASRIGIVWLYTSRAIENLRRIWSAFPIGP
jgi:predicted regulator of Ras-like GTPase activity (Roadblock/LC7/MglB family)